MVLISFSIDIIDFLIKLFHTIDGYSFIDSRDPNFRIKN